MAFRTSRRVKSRQSYVRSDGCFAWRMDVTEVTTTEFNQSNSISGGSHPPRAGYEIEMELSSTMT
ncbi:hypothetical protein ACHAXA_011876, partial [Cyclostephanos tholiformis]